MTNGEKIQQMFPRKCPHIGFNENFGRIWLMQDGEDFANFTLKWWNAEYKEPITENCIACKYDETEEEDSERCKKCLEGDSQFELDNEFVALTIKNDLGVDAVSRKDVHDMLENLPVTVEDKWFNWLQKACMRLAELPSVIPLPSELAKNSKKLEKNFGESDCISRQEVLYLIADNDLSMGQVVRGIHALPSVTPQEPRWIPVSEKLPEIHNYSEYYLVTLSNGEVTKVMFTETNGKSWWGWTQYKIVAWMPLPESYKLESER